MSAEIETLHKPFRKWLDGQSDFAYTYHRPDKPTGSTLGDADFIIYGSSSRCLHLEFKDKETRVTAIQTARHERLKSIGQLVFVLRDLTSAIEIIEAWREGRVSNAQSKPGARRIIVHGRTWQECRDGFHPVKQ